MPRWRFSVSGRVQGVGFRPYVARLAAELGLGGEVGNDPGGVFIEVEGDREPLEAFAARLPAEAPALARIAACPHHPVEVRGQRAFAIAASVAGGAPEVAVAVTPDAALCPACRREVMDPADRRHAYPFANCTACGPRYSIVQAVPYDRERTTMAGFALCPACRREFDDPADRRFHAQPVACPACGPRAWFASDDGREQAGDAIALAARLLQAGGILAVKGLGGFHLACRADDQPAVLRLRLRKQRDAKPFAVMVRDLAAGRTIADLDAAAERALAGPEAPILLVPRRAAADLAPAVANGTDLVGLMLPYTPLHLLLLAAAPPALVMTSGNPAGEPLCHDNAEAVARLAGIADGFLLHDRPIARPLDDSVLLATAEGPLPLRRARGLVPDPILLPITARQPLLAMGGDLKAAVGFARHRQAVLSEHLGDLEHPAAFRNFVQAIDRLGGLLGIRPAAVACDPHPAYHGSRHGRALGLPTVEVQHHHAHIASCLAEHGQAGPVIGIACDGTGWGPDGTIWGGEILLASASDCRRLARLMPIPLVGGDAGAAATWRSAAGWMQAVGLDTGAWTTVAAGRIDRQALDICAARLAQGRGAVPCSSLGRLFDAVAFLLDAADGNRFEGEAAMVVEALAMTSAVRSSGLTLLDPASRDLDTRPLLALILDGLRDGRPRADLAAAFHWGVCDWLAAAATHHARKEGLRTIALSGGCFANRLLLSGMRARLEGEGLTVLSHRLVPPGDGGLALGQLLVASARGG